MLVTRAQASALAEIDRTFHELGQIGIHAAQVVVNGILPDDAGDEELAAAVRRREAAALAGMPAAVASLPRDLIDLKPVNMVGLPALRSLLDPAVPVPSGAPVEIDVDLSGHTLAALVDQIEADGHGVVMCMGKGGVGKTTVATAIAVALAHRGHDVHLTTTDPAAHLEETLLGVVDRVTVSRIDPARATQEYRDRIMATRGRTLDDAGRASLAEDLLSPCTEEVAVFQQFSRIVLGARHEFVVIDTAPTGHTLLLLDAAGSYHRDIVRQMGEITNYRTPLMVLQDPTHTKVLLVTLPEPTPVVEAEVLQEDLSRAGITPWAWVVNSSLAAARPRSPFLRQRAAAELEQIGRVEKLSPRVAILPLLAQEPTGESRLAALAEDPGAPARGD